MAASLLQNYGQTQPVLQQQQVGPSASLERRQRAKSDFHGAKAHKHKETRCERKS